MSAGLAVPPPVPETGPAVGAAAVPAPVRASSPVSLGAAPATAPTAAPVPVPAPVVPVPVSDGGPANDQSRAPLADLLARELPGRFRWTVPGHLGGRCAPPRAVELLGEQLHAADLWPDQERYARALADSETLAARAWRAAAAHLLTGGATAGNLAWMFASLRAGDTVIVDSACHVSILTGLRLRPGVRPVWVQREIAPDLGVPLPLDPAAVARALQENPGARQVIVTSPSYAGTGSPVRAIADLAHAAGARLYVDAAWAPHGRWLPGDGLDPLASGADACVVSLHKTGAALSGAAVLLTAAGLDPAWQARVGAEVEGLRSTSPLLPVLASSDLARSALATAGAPGVAHAVELAADLRERCLAVPGVGVPGPVGDGPSDPLKLVLDVSAGGLTGFEVQRRLRAESTHVEGADLRRLYLVLPATPGLDESGAEARRALPRALGRVLAAAVRVGGGRRRPGRHLRVSPSVWAASRGEQVLLPSEAGERATERVPLERAAGRVAAEHAAPYPPGVPVWVPGERITPEAVALLREIRAAGGTVHGLRDPEARTVGVIPG